MSTDLEGRRVLVVGAATGIGRADEWWSALSNNVDGASLLTDAELPPTCG
jgi:hypothetical protein